MFTYERKNPSIGRADFVPVGWSGRKVEIIEFPSQKEDRKVLTTKGEDDFVEISVPVFFEEVVRQVLATWNQTTPEKIEII